MGYYENERHFQCLAVNLCHLRSSLPPTASPCFRIQHPTKEYIMIQTKTCITEYLYKAKKNMNKNKNKNVTKN